MCGFADVTTGNAIIKLQFLVQLSPNPIVTRAREQLSWDYRCATCSNGAGGYHLS